MSMALKRWILKEGDDMLGSTVYRSSRAARNALKKLPTPNKVTVAFVLMVEASARDVPLRKARRERTRRRALND